MIDMADKQIIPAVMKFSKSLADTAMAIHAAGADATVPTQLLSDVTEKLTQTKKAAVYLQ